MQVPTQPPPQNIFGQPEANHLVLKHSHITRKYNRLYVFGVVLSNSQKIVADGRLHLPQKHVEEFYSARIHPIFSNTHEQTTTATKNEISRYINKLPPIFRETRKLALQLQPLWS